MKPATFRETMGGLHTWTGLIFAWLLFFIFVTGTLGYVDTELDRWMQPELATQPPISAEEATALAQRYLQQHHPDAEEWFISLPSTRNTPWLQVFWRYPKDRHNQENSEHTRHRGRVRLDVTTGKVLQGRDTGGGQWLYKLHYKLAGIPRDAAKMLLGLFTMFMLLALITGVIIHRHIFHDFFSFRPGKRQRSWLDLHNLTSVASLPFQLMITYSGLIFFLISYMPFIAVGSYGLGGDRLQAFINEIFPREQIEQQHQNQPVPDLSQLVANAGQQWQQPVTTVEVHWPGDSGSEIHIGGYQPTILRVGHYMALDASGLPLHKTLPDSAPVIFHQGILGLHEGTFAGPVLRGFYLLSGLLGTLMIASGLILWASKRRARQLKQPQPDPGFMLVERLNAGTLIGLPAAIGLYFAANRLIPVALENRAELEQSALFISWGLILLYSARRPIQCCWYELSLLSATIYALLPLLSLITVEQHLFWGLANSDWALVGVELGFIATTVSFTIIARKLRQHWPQPGQRTPRKSATSMEATA
ncbi:MAG: PepSY domain-containing protein [Marinobacterium sp.]|nr:PepSY domain-containing protein [Marinobacterium sp.]